MRSWVLDVNAVLPCGSELSVAPLISAVAYTSTLGSCRVSSSAVAVSRTRSMNRLLKLPTTWPALARSEEHTSELQSLMRISYAVFCLKKKKTNSKAGQAHYNKMVNT